MALPHPVERLEALSRVAVFLGNIVRPCIGWSSRDGTFCREGAKTQGQLQLDFLYLACRALGQGVQDGEASFQVPDRFTIGQARRGMTTRFQPLIGGALSIARGVKWCAKSSGSRSTRSAKSCSNTVATRVCSSCRRARNSVPYAASCTSACLKR